MTGHVHAALMALYAQDAAETDKPWERWENRSRLAGSVFWSANVNHPEWNPALEYRRKPRTIRIGEFDVPEPLRGTPEHGISLWVATPCEEFFAKEIFADWFDGWHRDMLARGLIHLTREAAELHCRALLSFTRK